MKHLLIILLCSITLFSCQNASEKPSATLKVVLPSTKALDSGSGYDLISKTEVTLTSLFTLDAVENSEPYSETQTAENGVVSFSGLTVGPYKIEGRDLNKSDTIIAFGEKAVNIIPGENNITLTIDKFKGEGEANLAITFQPTRYVEGTTRLEINVQNYRGESVLTDTDFKSTVFGRSELTKTLEAGEYKISVMLYAYDKLVDGIVSAFRVINNHSMNKTISLYGTIVGSSGISIDDQISNQMSTSIKAVVGANNLVTLTCTPSALPTGYTSGELTYQWYKRGIIMPNENSNILSVTNLKEGRVGYTCYVSSNKLGTSTASTYYIY